MGFALQFCFFENLKKKKKFLFLMVGVFLDSIILYLPPVVAILLAEVERFPIL